MDARIRGGGMRIARADGDQYLISAAMDIGTSACGYAFCFRVSGSDPEIRMNKNWGHGYESYKAPTAVLTEKGARGKFVKFGFDAEETYVTLKENGESSDHELYHDFKMILYHEKNLDERRTKVTSANGTKRPLLDIFVMTIEYLRSHMLEAIAAQAENQIRNDQIRWVITVPTIWSNKAKQFMRSAAHKAGLIKKPNSSQLLVVTEPSAAGLYCSKQEANHFVGGPEAFERHDGLAFPPGTKYLVTDAGGGTVDFTTQEALDGDDIREMTATSGGDWGGREVNERFIELLRTALGESFIKTLMDDYPHQWYMFMGKFEKAKRRAEEGKALNIEIPSMVERAYRQSEKNEISDVINSKSNDLGISERNGILILSAQTTKGLFQPILDKICNHIESLVRKGKTKDISFVFLVGGFSECKLLGAAVKRLMSGVSVLTPHEAQLAIVKGAILYCNRPEMLKLRAKKTYGVATYTKFDPKVHPSSKKVMTRGEALCRSVFLPFVQQDDTIEFGVHGNMVAEPIDPGASSVSIDFFSLDRRLADNEVLFTDSKGVQRVGSTTVRFHGGGKKDVLLNFSFGQEVLVTAGSTSETASKVDIDLEFESTA